MALPFPDIPPDIFTVPGFHLGSLSLGPFPIRWYAMAYIAGILIGWRYAVGLVRNARLWGGRPPTLNSVQIDDLILWITFGVIVGGRIGYVLFYMLPLADQRDLLVSNPLEVFQVWHGGMSFHGGVIGVVVATLAYARVNKVDAFRVGDIIVACEPIGQFFGRLANFINGELWGRPTDLPWAMEFCGKHIQTYSDGTCVAGHVTRHPSQLYEAGLEGVVLFLILRWATHSAGWLQRRGAVTGLFLVGYGVFRILLENVRNPDEGLQHLPLGLTVGIMLSVPMVLGGAWLIWRGLKEPLPPAAARNRMNLRERLIAEIAESGPISVAEYMARCLHDPGLGYYATRPRLGADGDFITAPHVSQMFGELIGLWAAEVWARLDSRTK